MTNESGKTPVPHKKHVARLEREKQQTRLILYTFFGILAAVVLLLFYGWLDINYLQLNRTVAKVGETEIQVKDLEPRIRLRRQQLIDSFSQYQQYQQLLGMDMSAQLQSIQTQLNSPEVVGQSVLDELINEELVRQEAAKRGIIISEAELNAEIEAGFNYYPNGTPAPTVTPTAIIPPTDPAELLQFITATPNATATPQSTATPAATEEAESTLEATATATTVPSATPTLPPVASPTPFPTATPYTQEGFENQIAETNESLAKFGLGENYYREFFEMRLLTEKVKEIITADVKPTQEQIRARHILVADEQIARDIIARLQAGEDFAQLAAEFGSDGTASQGGDLGWFGKGMMVPEFETAAYALQNPGDFTTEPVTSQFGFHVIQLMARQERPLTAEEFQRAKDAAFQEWLTAAREEYGVETFDVWQSRVPTVPNFITAATEAVSAQQTSQAETVSTLDAAKTQTPQP